MTRQSSMRRLDCLWTAFAINAPVYKRICNAIIAARWMKNTRMYMEAIGMAPNYIDPTSYTEKMQCRKLFDRNPAFPVFSDKLLTRKYVAEQGFDHLLPDLLWSGSNFEKIPFDLLAPYIIKPSHRSGVTIVVRAGNVVDEQQVKHTCKRWLRKRRSHGRSVGEWGYKNGKGKVMIERLLPVDDGALFPDDYKVFVFDGHAAFIHVRSVGNTMGRGGGGSEILDTFYDREWNQLPYRRWREGIGVGTCPRGIRKPTCLDQMLNVAEKLATGFDHLRVDFYVIGDMPVIGELTVYNESGFVYLFPEDAVYESYPPRMLDYKYGSMWHQPSVPIATKLRRLIWD